MIHYQLRCGGAHEFDGWFKDSAAFEEQATGGQVACPICADTKVSRALMTPGVPKKQPRPVATEPATARSPNRPVQSAGGAMPDRMRAALHKLRAEVEKSCDYVGADFAEEARRMHNGDAPARGIYGETTPSQAESLADEGIEIASIPWLPRSDS